MIFFTNFNFGFCSNTFKINTIEDGYSFAGWYTTWDCTGSPVSTALTYTPTLIDFTGDLRQSDYLSTIGIYNLYAKFEPNVYTVTLNGKCLYQGFNGDQVTNIQYEYEKELIKKLH